MKVYRIGQKITVNHKLERVSEGQGWRNRKWITSFLPNTEVYVIGVRQLANGYVDGDSTDGYWFVAKENIKALLVTKNIRTKPFYVLNNEE
jgi:hypothetical protein